MIGQRLKELREEKGIIQAELALLTGLQRPVISMYETNARYPSEENLNKIKAILFISDDDIFTEEVRQICLENLRTKATTIQLARSCKKIIMKGL